MLWRLTHIQISCKLITDDAHKGGNHMLTSSRGQQTSFCADIRFEYTYLSSIRHSSMVWQCNSWSQNTLLIGGLIIIRLISGSCKQSHSRDNYKSPLQQRTIT